jgi:hypothetical protein
MLALWQTRFQGLNLPLVVEIVNERLHGDISGALGARISPRLLSRTASELRWAWRKVPLGSQLSAPSHKSFHLARL